MTTIQHTVSNALCIDCRRFSGNEKQTDEKSRGFRSKNIVDLISSRHHGFKDMTFAFSKTPFTPFIAIVSGFQHRLLIVPVAEHIASHIVRVDILRIFQPIMM